MTEEGYLSGLTGGEADAGAEGEAAAGGLDATAAALAAAASSANANLAAAAERYFRKQERLVELQTEHLHEQRMLTLSHLRLRRVADWFRTATQLLIVLVVAAIAAGFALMLHDAFDSNEVVVDAFDTAPSLAAEGVSGKEVASAVLDALQKLSAATRALTKGRATTSAWQNDVQIEVPEAGISIGEVSRLLHARFGNDLHIGGNLRLLEGGRLALTVRGDGVPAKTFTGGIGDLEALTTRAAEYVYGTTQAQEYMIFLAGSGRYEEALQTAPGALARASTDQDRSIFATDWGDALAFFGRSAESESKYHLAVRLDPWNWTARNNLIVELGTAYGDEAAWREAQAMIREADALPPARRPALLLYGNAALLVWDLPLALRSEQADARLYNGAGTFFGSLAATIADTYALMHDPAAADRTIAVADEADPGTRFEALLLRAYPLLTPQDATRAVPLLESARQLGDTDAQLKAAYPYFPCFLGDAYGLAGQLDKAEAEFKQGPNLAMCAAYHGDVLDHAGDPAGARRVWAESLRTAPDLPLVYLHRGTAEMQHGEMDEAAADLAASHEKAPHFADPLKSWGDLLAQQGKWRDAKAKYEAALAFAPNWSELHAAADAATSHLR
jgi:tetratricopeptide (TPR) repeat protein